MKTQAFLQRQNNDICPRCTKAVYFAEAKDGPNSVKFHRGCFTCMMCKKALDSSFAERQGEIYCKSCYGKEFGPKGFGFSGMLNTTSSPSTLSTGPNVNVPTGNDLNSAGSLSNVMRGGSQSENIPVSFKGDAPTSNVPTKGRFGGGEACVRCMKTVYVAETREGPNNSKYHKSCFTCKMCQKGLDSTFTERQGEIYCKPCYGREFGLKGFGFGGTL